MICENKVMWNRITVTHGVNTKCRGDAVMRIATFDENNYMTCVNIANVLRERYYLERF